MKKTLSVLLCVLFLAASVPSFTFAAATAAVSGTVTDTSKNPVEGATITAKDANGNVIGTAVSDAQGNYTIELPVGTSYTLEISPPALYSQKSVSPPPSGTVGAQGAVINWVVSRDLAPVWYALGGATFIAGSVGAALGTQNEESHKKKIVTGTE